MIRLEQVCWKAGVFSLEVEVALHGRVTGLFGPSGSGKTSFVEVLAGLRRPQAGRIAVGERMLFDSGTGLHLPPEQRQMGYVPQDGALFPHLTVEQNLRYGAARGRISETESSPPFRFERVCEILGIGHLRRSGVGGVSGGERQRIALARAILSRPHVLLLDEPLASLDATRKEAILPYLARVRDEIRLPMVYVSHAPEELMALCDDVLVLANGRIVQHGKPQALFELSDRPSYVLRAGL